jgi:hypothetical protein
MRVGARVVTTRNAQAVSAAPPLESKYANDKY